MNILITGGASGLGAAIVNALVKESGDTIYFTYSKSLAAAKETEAAHPNTKAIFCDFGNEDSLRDLLSQMPGMNLDILINNAFVGMHKDHFHKMDHNVFQNSFQQNIVPALRITQEAIKGFRKKKFGKIINIISTTVANKPLNGLSEYVANKAYMLSMSKSWANENIRFNITSNSISPSLMLTNLTTHDTDERVIEQLQEAHPLRKLLTPDEVAEAVVFFTKAPQHVNGTNLFINAGADIV